TDLFGSAEISTTPLPASRKIHVASAHAADVVVPFREIAITDAETPAFRVYDTSGPYTDPTVTIDVRKGLARPRTRWIAERSNTE
ncbi:hypothetical protein NYY90_20560, partial [Acinetobacter baumannii]|nr:hypothetical protein [Acinetobacter baumannii]